MAQYLTYEEYAVMGGKVDEADFPRAEYRARRRIDAMTHGRTARMAEGRQERAAAEGRSPEPMPDEVRAAVAEIIDVDAVFGATAQAGTPAVVSFATDGYSEDYGNARERGVEAQRLLTAGIAALLDGVTDDEGVPLLYAGVGTGT